MTKEMFEKKTGLKLYMYQWEILQKMMMGWYPIPITRRFK